MPRFFVDYVLRDTDEVEAESSIAAAEQTAARFPGAKIVEVLEVPVASVYLNVVDLEAWKKRKGR